MGRGHGHLLVKGRGHVLTLVDYYIAHPMSSKGSWQCGSVEIEEFRGCAMVGIIVMGQDEKDLRRTAGRQGRVLYTTTSYGHDPPMAIARLSPNNLAR